MDTYSRNYLIKRLRNICIGKEKIESLQLDEITAIIEELMLDDFYKDLNYEKHKLEITRLEQEIEELKTNIEKVIGGE